MVNEVWIDKVANALLKFQLQKSTETLNTANLTAILVPYSQLWNTVRDNLTNWFDKKVTRSFSTRLTH